MRQTFNTRPKIIDSYRANLLNPTDSTYSASNTATDRDRVNIKSPNRS